MEILDLLNEESISERAMVELVYKFDKKSYLRMFEKVSRPLKYDSNIFSSTNI